MVLLGFLLMMAAGANGLPAVGLTDQEFASAMAPWTAGLPETRFAFRAGGQSAYAGDPRRRDEAGPLGSVTKPVFATIALRLEAARKLARTAKLSSFRLHVPGDDGVTVGQLLNHTSGYPECMHGFDPGLPFDRTKLMSLIVSAAGRKTSTGVFQYSNTNYALLGMVCEAVAGKSADELVRDEVDRPLGVSLRTARLPDFDLNWYGGAGNLVGTVEDVAKLGEAISGGHEHWLSPQARSLMCSPTTRMENGSDYGLGIIVAHLATVPSASHAGEVPTTPGYSCFLAATLPPMAPAGFAVQFRGNVMEPNKLNSIYGAYASACGLLEAKRWVSRMAANPSPADVRALGSARGLTAETIAALSGLRDVARALGPNPTLEVTSEIIRGDRIETAVRAGRSRTIAFRFGVDMKLEAVTVSGDR